MTRFGALVVPVAIAAAAVRRSFSGAFGAQGVEGVRMTDYWV